MTQLGLFDDPPLPAPASHRGDPDSSREAAQRTRDSGRQRSHCQLVLRMLRRLPGRTAAEVWAEGNEFERFALGDVVELRRRLTDLHRAGKARQGEQRACRVAETKALTWLAIEDAECLT